jgi:hypothetical protein
MKTCSCLKIFESFNYFVELFKVQSSPNPLIVSYIQQCKLPKTEKCESQEPNHERSTPTNSMASF